MDKTISLFVESMLLIYGTLYYNKQGSLFDASGGAGNDVNRIKIAWLQWRLFVCFQVVWMAVLFVVDVYCISLQSAAPIFVLYCIDSTFALQSCVYTQTSLVPLPHRAPP